MRNKETLLEELDWLADKISSQVWTLNLGTLATTWSLLIAAGSVEKLRIGSANAIPIMGLCIFSDAERFNSISCRVRKRSIYIGRP